MKSRHTGWVQFLVRFVLSAVVTIVTTAQARPFPESGGSEAWVSLGLDLEFTKKFLNSERCASGDAYRLSMLAAINFIEKRLSLPLTADSAKFCSSFEATLSRLAATGGEDLPPAMIYGLAINTHLRYFDPHAYLKPILRDGASPHFDFTGAGLILAPSVLGFKILDLLPESPLPLRYGDEIVAVAAKKNAPFVDLKGLNAQQAQKLIHGRSGTEVSLRVLRGDTTFYVTLPRAPFTLENVSVRRLPGLPHTALVRIGEFLRDQTCMNLRKQLTILKNDGYDHLLLDLRGNFGGNAEEAICATALFVGARPIMGARYLKSTIPELALMPVFIQGSRLFWRYGTAQTVFDFNMAVLVDSTTASAAELMAGALQIDNRAWLVGNRTFGKGSLQMPVVFGVPNSESPYQLEIGTTTQLFYLENFMSVQKVGLTPSFSLNAPERSLREADLFPTSQPAENAAWADTRQECISKIQKQLDRDKLYAHAQTELDTIPPRGDDPRALGLAVLRAADRVKAQDCHR